MGSIPGMSDKNHPDPYKMTQEQLEIAIQKERENWDKAGLDVSGVGHNIFQMDCVITSLIKILADKEIITADELALATNQRMLEKLIDCREQFEGQVARAKLLAGVHQEAPKVILGPDGQPKFIV